MSVKDQSAPSLKLWCVSDQKGFIEMRLVPQV